MHNKHTIKIKRRATILDKQKQRTIFDVYDCSNIYVLDNRSSMKFNQNTDL